MKIHLSIFWRKGLWALMSLSFLLLICFGGFYIYAESQLPDVDSLKNIQLQVPLQIYSQEGQLIQEYGEKKRIPVTYDEIPQALVHALVATEDQRFFEHPGVDVMGLGRAAVRMIQTGTKSQGGSTITMQVARNFFLNRKKTFLRKFNEILLAIKIDRELSKEKILELYLNKIYLGNRAYGVGAAAQVYYGKELKELSLAQLAMIAGLPQAPSSQNPIANPTAAKKRRNHVLERLLETDYITQEAYQEAINEPITARYHGVETEAEAPYVAEMIRQSLYDHFGPDAYTRGYKVYTTIHADLQDKANSSVQKHLLAYDHRHGYRGPVSKLTPLEDYPLKTLRTTLKHYPVVNELIPVIILSVEHQEATALTQAGDTITIPWSGLSWARPSLKKHGWVGKLPERASQVVSKGDVVYITKNNKRDTWELTQIPQAEAALVALNPSNGAIEALVGGFNFQRSKFNRATQADRQPGSSFKPFIYAGALAKGYTLATLINDAPIAMDDPSQEGLWRPHNANHTFNGPTRFKAALTGSRNLVSIRILDDIGIDYAVDFVSRFGFHKENLPHTLSLVLGTLTTSPLDLASAYAVFANNGYKVEPYLIDKIIDADGHVLLQATPTQVPPDDGSIIESVHMPAPRVLSEEVAFLMNTALRGVVQGGTARAAQVLNRQDIAGKTGTTNNQIDAWFAGYNPDLVVTTWVGFDNPSPLHEYASGLSLPLWVDFMRTALQDKPEQELNIPEHIVSRQINRDTGLLDTSNSASSIQEYFHEDSLPDEASSHAHSSDEDESTPTRQDKKTQQDYLF
jgi:penicillin-binding protein 1A|tara:strand:+ start:13773 stop:16172 length:2400 start_codon:yes stop_codon:yes gene_type:complete